MTEEDKREEAVVIEGGDKGGGKGMDKERSEPIAYLSLRHISTWNC